MLSSRSVNQITRSCTTGGTGTVLVGENRRLGWVLALAGAGHQGVVIAGGISRRCAVCVGRGRSCHASRAVAGGHAESVTQSVAVVRVLATFARNRYILC